MPWRVEEKIREERGKIWSLDEKRDFNDEWGTIISHMERSSHFPREILDEARVYAEEARLFVKATQTTHEHTMLFGTVGRVTPHHVFVVSGQDIFAFNRSPLVQPDLVEGDEWVPKPYPARIPGRKARSIAMDM